MEERELECSEERPLVGWRLFRIRIRGSGPVLTAPLIHDPDFELFPSTDIVAACYNDDHPAPAPGCRCGLYAAIEGTLDSLSGYLLDSAHDLDPAVYAEVVCTGRVFVDLRGVRAERVRVLRIAASPDAWPDAQTYAQTMTALGERYGIEVGDLDAVPEWVLSNVMPQGTAPDDSTLDLDALVSSIGRRHLDDP